MTEAGRASAVVSRAPPLARRAWATLGLPLAAEPIVERTEGIVDPEALLLATLILPGGADSSLELDIAAWAAVTGRLLNRTRLAILFARLQEHQRAAVLGRLGSGPLGTLPKPLKTAFGFAGEPDPALLAAVESRRARIAGPERVYAACAMIRNRLLFAVGARADIASITSVRADRLGGKTIARLAATSEATVSRIVRDLKACGHLDRFRRRTPPGPFFPGLFVSADTPLDLAEVVDASRFGDDLLERDALAGLDLRFDGLVRAATEEDRQEVAPPARAEEMSHPETFGRTATDRVIVE